MRFLRHTIVLLGLALLVAMPAAAQTTGPTGAQLAATLQNQLVVRTDGAIFLIRDGARHLVTPATASDDDLATIPEGGPYTAGLQPTDASAAQAGQQGTNAPSILGSGPSASGTSATTNSASLPSSVHVSLNEWSITPDAAVLAAGKVTFNVSDDGKAIHEMILVKSDMDPANLPVTRSHVDEPSIGQKVGELEGLHAGDNKSATWDLKPGTYILICNLANHYTKGMVAQVQVK